MALPDFVALFDIPYEIVVAGNLASGGDLMAWIVDHDTRQIFINRSLAKPDRRMALRRAVCVVTGQPLWPAPVFSKPSKC